MISSSISICTLKVRCKIEVIKTRCKIKKASPETMEAKKDGLVAMMIPTEIQMITTTKSALWYKT